MARPGISTRTVSDSDLTGKQSDRIQLNFGGTSLIKFAFNPGVSAAIKKIEMRGYSRRTTFFIGGGAGKLHAIASSYSTKV
jgi:hypothetical protein